MTIRLLCAYLGYPCNAIVTLDAGTEAGLIAAKMADSNLTGGTPYVAPVVADRRISGANFTVDAAGNIKGIVEPDGDIIPLYNPAAVVISGGNSDDAGTINAAINSLSAFGGGAVLLGGSKYNLSHQINLRSNVHLYSQGAILRINNQIQANLSANASAGQNIVAVNSTAGMVVGMQMEIKDSNGKELIYIGSIVAGAIIATANLANPYTTAAGASVASNFSAIVGDGVGNVSITGIEVDGNKANNPDDFAWDNSYSNGGIFFNNSSNIRLLNNYIHDVANHGILFQETYNAAAIGNTSNSNGRHGIDVYTANPANVLNVTIADGTYNNNGQYGVQIHQGTFVSVKGNHSSGNVRGFSVLLANNVSLVGNMATGNTQDGFQSDTSKRLMFSANQSYNNAIFGYRLASSMNCVMTGNLSQNNYTSGAHTAEISIEGGSTYNNVSNNMVVKSAGSVVTGIKENSTADDFNIISTNSYSGGFTTTASVLGPNSRLIV